MNVDLKDLTQIVNRFIAHWNTVNVVFPTKTLTLAQTTLLPDGMTLDGLIDLRDEIAADFVAVVTVDNVAQEKQAQRKARRQAILVPQKLFLKTVQSYLPESAYLSLVPKTPSIGANDRAFEDACEDSAGVWAKLNADTTLSLTRPLVLSNGSTQATFVALLSEVKAAHGDSPGAKVAAQRVRTTRDEKIKRALGALKLYRKTVPAFLPPGHALLETVPTLG
ncbi:hypothetical protein [Armatimonas sp.]|uniref:hypothetical protein n=1 Tax=Armatimonas sp. TaxID=1872638 RepID=UPI00374D903A